MTTTPKDPVAPLMALVRAFGNCSPGDEEEALDAIEASARALAAVPAAEVQESVRWKQLVHMVERGVAPEILVDWINHPDRLDYAAKLRAEHG